jgi:hypothetical protein
MITLGSNMYLNSQNRICPADPSKEFPGFVQGHRALALGWLYIEQRKLANCYWSQQQAMERKEKKSPGYIVYDQYTIAKSMKKSSGSSFCIILYLV